MTRFDVTYEIVTPESAEDGDIEESGFELQGGTLRQAVDAVSGTRTSACDGVECVEFSASHIDSARWITINNGMEFETGACESRLLHFPDNLTESTKRRIGRLLGARS